MVHVTYDTSTGTWTSAKVSPGTTSTFQQVGEGLGVGGNSVPALYAMGVISDNSDPSSVKDPYYGAYRSLDGGATWKRINDNQHQFGLLSALSGDSRVFGRVYIGINGRGIRVGDVIWTSDSGSDDLKLLDHLVVSPATATIAVGESQVFTARGFNLDGTSWDATPWITFTMDTGTACPAHTCTATAAGNHTVTAATTGGTIHATATLSVTAPAASPSPTPTAVSTASPTSATPSASRATPPTTSTGAGRSSDETAGTILLIPVALVLVLGSLMYLGIRGRRRAL
jgi:hypothetical protein